VRGAALGNIPILDDNQETYLSQNHNALNVSLLADVGTIIAGGAIAGASGGLGAAIGSSAVIGGVKGLLNTQANIADQGMVATNPVAFLGSALMANYSGKFWVVTTHTRITNADDVHNKFGYPYNMVDDLSFPVTGFISTKGCSVITDGTVPSWAVDEINNMFDKGVRVF
jgi:hypothetical protein